ncbi:hypothetical protein, partial [Pseudomonas sp. MD332_6]|uniref:hypothetical protein n=1 Tax=Pseudomonas sp. MD332_6 TaxID=3241256 RepID=UPI0036D239A5
MLTQQLASHMGVTLKQQSHKRLAHIPVANYAYFIRQGPLAKRQPNRHKRRHMLRDEDRGLDYSNNVR